MPLLDELKPGLPAVFATACQGSEVVGVGQLVIESGWGGVQCMATDLIHRRRGAATAVPGGLAAEAHRGAVDRLYLAVMADNDAATGLYGSAGFRSVHEYSYYLRQGVAGGPVRRRRSVGPASRSCGRWRRSTGSPC